MTLTENQRIIIRSWLGDVPVEDILNFMEADTQTRVSTLVAYAQERSLRIEQTQADIAAASERAQAEATALQALLSGVTP